MAELTHAVRVHLWQILLGGLLLVLGLVVYTIVQLGSMRSSQATQARVVTALSSNLAGAQAQLKQHGIQPSQPAPSQIIAQAGPAGATGPSGPSGPSGPAGASGSSGPSGVSGSPGSPGPTGATGAAGANGRDGNDGAAGASGPSGAAGSNGSPGPSGPVGAQGSSGEQGPTGAAGAPGASGPPGQDPSGWVYVDTLGVTHTCSPDSQTPAPHYTCT